MAGFEAAYAALTDSLDDAYTGFLGAAFIQEAFYYGYALGCLGMLLRKPDLTD